MILNGFVSLVGAGPGDPDLITRRGLTRLREATLVLYDALISFDLLAEAPKARRLFVGKRANRHAMKQQTIERLMIRYARRGERVVRLKCGDPFVFGRGGEELEALLRAGIACEVVPGVSSCIAAPGAVGIPVTHRGLASGFLCTTGHDTEALAKRIRGWVPDSFTLVILMGYRKRAELAEVLIGSGFSKNTPCAFVAGATFQDQRVFRTSLGQLSELMIPGDHASTLVVGEVVSLHHVLPSYSPNPASEGFPKQAMVDSNRLIPTTMLAGVTRSR